MTIPVLPNLHGFSVHKKPTFSTIMRTPPSGREVGRFQAPVPLWEFELTYEVLRDQTQNQIPYANLAGFTEFQQITQVFVALGGQFARFYFNDISDNSRTGQLIGIGNGTNVSFRMLRTWGSGNLAYTEPVGGINQNQTVNVYLNGVLQSPTSYGFDSTNKFLVFNSAPSNGVIITADFYFYYLCRFIEDKLDLEQFYYSRWSIKSFKFRSVNDDGLGISILNNLTNSLPVADPAINPGPFGLATSLYWEIQVVTSGTTAGFGGGGFTVCAGIANENFQLIDPWSLNVNSTGPTVANGLFWGFIFGGDPNPGWGYPNRPGSGPPCIAGGDWLGFAIDLVNQKLLIRNSTQDPNRWFGETYNGPFDPTKGFDYSTDGGLSPISGPVYILGGAGWGATLPFPQLTLNLSGSFAAALPPGVEPWGRGEWNPGDCAPGITVAGGNTLIANSGISGSNQPTAFTRSSTSYASPP